MNTTSNHVRARDSATMEFYRRYVLDPQQSNPDEAREHDLAIHRRWLDFIEKFLCVLIAHQGNQNCALNCQMSTRAMALALGFYAAAGADTPGHLARQMGIHKATVDKTLNTFIFEKLHLPPLPGQRDENARRKMSESRISQLKTEKL